MRSIFPSLRLAPVLVLFVLGGCHPAYRRAFARAEAAALRGDFDSAALHYREACEARPEERQACTRAVQFSEKAANTSVRAARPACEAGDLDQCLPPLLHARGFQPGHVELNALLVRASQLHTERCASQWKDEGQLTTALAGLACLQSRAKQLPVDAYQTLLAERSQQLASRFMVLLAGPLCRCHPAARHVRAARERA